MGLGAQWREGLLAQKVVQGNTKGWRNHPQLNRFKEHCDSLEAAGYYLLHIHLESRQRGYNYNFTKILKPVESVEKINLNRGQLIYEYDILQERLSKRSPEKYLENLRITEITPHPLFKPIDGPPELWEKSYWNNINQ
jgi:hypothetical protein